ncbi:MAG: SpoVA/SpoVAEb family sporulation membrane protein [Eubacterium sp.]|nr:SpoVA/SpoVAEb family sporulation membrane protein [Eubacterium sp.]
MSKKRVENAGNNKLENVDVEKLKKIDIENETDEKRKQEKYNQYVKQVTPARSLPLSMLKAFLVGGAICLLGQIITSIAMSRGLDQETAGSWTSLILILLSVILTGLNIYPSFAQFGGAGALVPITGFANGVAASAIEEKVEGQVFGIGCQIFSIAGPVILYGIFTSWVLGVIYLIGKTIGVV